MRKLFMRASAWARRHFHDFFSLNEFHCYQSRPLFLTTDGVAIFFQFAKNQLCDQCAPSLLTETIRLSFSCEARGHINKYANTCFQANTKFQ